MDAGLPNITGYCGLVMYAGNGTGTFSGSLNDNNLPGGAGAGGLNFNASRSNSIYGSSDTVTPTSLTCITCIRY